MRSIFAAIFFTNTPDILPFHLQNRWAPDVPDPRRARPRPCPSVYGIYSGFELCENAAAPGREEYLDSEKYQLKERDWDAPGNIKELIIKVEPHPERKSRAPFLRQPPFSSGRQRSAALLQQGHPGARQHHS